MVITADSFDNSGKDVKVMRRAKVSVQKADVIKVLK